MKQVRRIGYQEVISYSEMEYTVLSDFNQPAVRKL